MSLSEFEIIRLKRLFDAYCEVRIPQELNTKLRLDYRIRDSHLTLYESRHHHEKVDLWYSTAIARFEKDPQQQVWRLFSADRNESWLPYHPHPEDRDIERLLDCVTDDPTGIFWG
nr:DUF3024 domain-containing protein [uncultured Desulfuromonas sp.]